MTESDRQNKIRARFADIAALPDDDIPLDEAALLIAAEAEEEIDVGHYLGELDKLAIAFKQDQRFNTDFGIPIPALLNYIHSELEFSGNINDYYDPANSYLNRVIDHRTGIPISLALGVVSAFALSPDGRYLYLASYDNGQIARLGPLGELGTTIEIVAGNGVNYWERPEDGLDALEAELGYPEELAFLGEDHFRVVA